MKKKALYLFMITSMLLLAAGCNKKDAAGDNKGTEDTATETTETTETTDTANATVTPAATETGEERVLPKVEDYVASDYITLGKYKGVEVTVNQLTVTEENVDTAIQEELSANATQEEVTDRAVQNGDIVNIDYEGLKDDVAFEGGTAKGADLEIGSHSFIDGFEEGLIGAKIGDTVKLDLTFPENYGSAELAGKAVVFNVKINSIKKTVVPELNDEYVVNNTDYDTIDAYKESVRSTLEKSNQEKMDNEKASNVITTIIDGSKITEIPKTLTDYYTAQIQYSMEDEAAYYGVDIETYVANYGMTMDDYNEYVTSLVDAYSKRDLLINAVAQKEKMEASQEEVDKAVTDYMTTYGLETKEDLFAKMTEDEIKDSVVMQEAYDFIIDNAVVKYATAAK